MFNVINYCLLIAKFHIDCQSIHNKNAIDLFQYLIEFKHKLKIEYYIIFVHQTLLQQSLKKFNFYI